jgi:hypothetical protein
MPTKYRLIPLILIVLPIFALTAYSPVTAASSDDHEPLRDQDSSMWERVHHLNRDDELGTTDPTYSLDDDTAWPGMREEYSDFIFPDLK